MRQSNFDENFAISQNGVNDNWNYIAPASPKPELGIGEALHQMSQNVTILLTTLELSQLSGELLPEDITLLVNTANNLRDYIEKLRLYNRTK